MFLSSVTSACADRRGPRVRHLTGPVTALVALLAVVCLGLPVSAAVAATGTATAPTTLTGSRVSTSAVRLSWAAPGSTGSSPVSRYDVREATSGVTQRTSANVLTYTWQALDPQAVTFKVRAIPAAGAGEWAQVTVPTGTTAQGSTSSPAPTPAPTPNPGPSSPARLPAGARYVATSGSDTAAGTAAPPLRTIKRGLARLRAGDTLIVRGGRYVENVTGQSLASGTASSRITVRAYPGERPILVGLLWLTNASYWTVDGLDVTWNAANSAANHMVKMSGGLGWRLTNAEIWGARSF